MVNYLFTMPHQEALVQRGRASTAQVAPPNWPDPVGVGDVPVPGAMAMAQESGETAESLFCRALARLGIGQVLDLGGSIAFAANLRRHGYGGVLYSLQPARDSYLTLLANARDDALWFPLARQGAGATAFFAQLGDERVFIHPSASLLRAQAMQGIEALRVDAGAAAAGALEGYRPLLERVRLILLQRSDASEGAAGINAEERGPDALAPEVPGFTRLPSPAAQGADGVGGGDVFYCRADGRPRPRPQGISVAAVIISIGGTIERRLPDGSDLGPLWLQSCIQSWQHFDAPVVSVSERAPPDGIQWARTEARPSLAQMLAAIPMPADSHVLLTNADIVLTDALREQLSRLHPEAVYYGSRLEVERAAGQGGLTPRGIYELGFDYFLLPASFVEAVLADGLLPAQMRIGEPWWDYLLPVLALARGFPLKKLGTRQALAIHYMHPARYSTELWLRNRELFIRVVSQLLAQPDCHAAGTLTELLANPNQLAHLICRCLP